MKRVTMCAAALGLIINGFAQAHDDNKNNSSQSTITVNGTGNGTGNKTEIDPTAGSKVDINGSANGKNNSEMPRNP